MIIENLKEELKDNEVKDQDKVLELFSILKEPINCISSLNPEHEKIRIFHKELKKSVFTTAGHDNIQLYPGSIIYNDNLIKAIIQEHNGDLTYYF